MMITRIAFAGVLALSLLATPVTVDAQQTRSVRTIAFFGPPPEVGGLVQAFQQGLRDLGYVEGQNIRIAYRYTDVAVQGHADLFPRFATELVRLKPDVIVVSIIEAALAVRNATSTIPIVMVNVQDPVAAGLVSSLARPGGNVTGLSRQSRDLIGKRLQLLREALPDPVPVGVLADATTPLNSMMVADTKEAARTLGVQIKIVDAGVPTDFEGAFSTLHTERVGAVLVFASPAFYLNRKEIAGLTLRHRLPAIFENREFVEAGGLLSYSVNSVANYRRAALFVDKVLKGAKPADLPVEQPTKFEFVINLKTARTLGLTIPPSLLLRADQIIE